MPRAIKGAFKCAKCSRAFSMAAHLARHTSTIHATNATRAKAEARRKLKRPGHVKAGRPTIVSSRLRLHELSFEQLRQVVESVRDEAQRRLSDFEEVFA